jgi:NADPH2:quinone reductase
VHDVGEPADVLRLDDVPVPGPGPGQVRVRVEAVGLNFPDLLLCRGQYQEKPPLPFTPGLEVAGTVDAVGDGADQRVGARVVGGPVLPLGGLAEHTILAADQALDLPDDVPSTDAAAMFITYHTAHVGLHRRAALRPGETLLVHGGAGGVGSAAIQLGKAAGARVIATAGGQSKVDVCRSLGAVVGIDYSAEDFVAAVKDVTAGRGADVVWDPVGGDVFDASRRCIAFEGRLVVVGFASGRIPQVPAGHVLVKNYSVVGLHWGMYRAQEPTLLRQTHEALLDLYAAGTARPLISDVLPLDQALEALRRIDARQVTGKLVLVP